MDRCKLHLFTSEDAKACVKRRETEANPVDSTIEPDRTCWPSVRYCRNWMCKIKSTSSKYKAAHVMIVVWPILYLQTRDNFLNWREEVLFQTFAMESSRPGWKWARIDTWRANVIIVIWLRYEYSWLQGQCPWDIQPRAKRFCVTYER